MMSRKVKLKWCSGFGQLLLALLCGFVVVPVSSAEQPVLTPGGVIGKDDRKPMNSAGKPWIAVGRVHAPKTGRVDLCSGTLIDPKVVVTAAHCVYNHVSGKPIRPSTTHFLAGYHKGKYAAHSVAACIKPSPSFKFSRKLSAKNAAADYAFIVLKTSIEIPVVRVYDRDRITVADWLVHAGYCCDRPYILSVHDGCQVKEIRSAAYLTDCDSAAGASGGPVFVKTNGGHFIAAVMSSRVSGRSGRHETLNAIASILHERDSLDKIKTCN